MACLSVTCPSISSFDLHAPYFSVDDPSNPETSLLDNRSTSNTLAPDSEPDPRNLLMTRQREYKVAALSAKRAGDLERARELMRIGKV